MYIYRFEEKFSELKQKFTSTTKEMVPIHKFIENIENFKEIDDLVGFDQTKSNTIVIKNINKFESHSNMFDKLS